MLTPDNKRRSSASSAPVVGKIGPAQGRPSASAHEPEGHDQPPLPPRVLVVDGDPIVAESLAEYLTKQGFFTATASDGPEALDLLRTAVESSSTHTTAPLGPFGVVLADINMPRCDGIDFLRQLKKNHPGIVPIVVTGYGKIEQAVECIKLGANDYLTKPIIEDELRIAVDKALRQHVLLAENQNLRDQLSQRFGLNNIVGSDYRMQKVYDLVESVAASKTTVLVQGESGTGKTMVAHAIHTLSQRKAAPFITFACGSIPETLLESELFGHVKGAFTGADADKPGKILAADTGTLFIDEINSATPALQLKLLRVLQERQFEPVGSQRTLHVDVRFVLATNQPLKHLVEQGRFREDLYYRINVVNIQLPPLRDRLGDIPLLADHFLSKWCRELNKERTFSPQVIEALQTYPWPGNVRELENAVERAVVLSRRTMIELHDLPETFHPADSSSDSSFSHSAGATHTSNLIPALANGWNPMPLEQALMEPEKHIILAALKANQWNRQETARQLNINRTTLYKKMKILGIDDLLAG